MVETDTASVELLYDEEETAVTITVMHKIVPLEPCSAHHPLHDDESLARSISLFSQFISLTAELTELPQTPFMDW